MARRGSKVEGVPVGISSARSPLKTPSSPGGENLCLPEFSHVGKVGGSLRHRAVMTPSPQRHRRGGGVSADRQPCEILPVRGRATQVSSHQVTGNHKGRTRAIRAVLLHPLPPHRIHTQDVRQQSNTASFRSGETNPQLFCSLSLTQHREQSEAGGVLAQQPGTEAVSLPGNRFLPHQQKSFWSACLS